MEYNQVTYVNSAKSIYGRELFVNIFMRRVYNWMALGLGVSALLAWFITNTPYILFTLINPISGTPTIFFWFVLISELILVYTLSSSIQRISISTAIILFLVYSALNGFTLGLALLAYTNISIMKAFLITAVTFIITNIWASSTKKDLSKLGSFFMMGLIGITVASVGNLFFNSSMIDWVVSIIGVGLFIGLTAYDTQKFRYMVTNAANEVTVSKMAILGALSLYLNFLNLFLMLLKLFGDRRD